MTDIVVSLGCYHAVASMVDRTGKSQLMFSLQLFGNITKTIKSWLWRSLVSELVSIEPALLELCKNASEVRSFFRHSVPLVELVCTRVVGVLSKIVNVDVDLSTGDEHLQLIVIKRPQPVDVDHIVQPTTKRLTMRPYLLHTWQLILFTLLKVKVKVKSTYLL